MKKPLSSLLALSIILTSMRPLAACATELLPHRSSVCAATLLSVPKEIKRLETKDVLPNIDRVSKKLTRFIDWENRSRATKTSLREMETQYRNFPGPMDVNLALASGDTTVAQALNAERMIGSLRDSIADMTLNRDENTFGFKLTGEEEIRKYRKSVRDLSKKFEADVKPQLDKEFPYWNKTRKFFAWGDFLASIGFATLVYKFGISLFPAEIDLILDRNYGAFSMLALIQFGVFTFTSSVMNHTWTNFNIWRESRKGQSDTLNKVKNNEPYRDRYMDFVGDNIEDLLQLKGHGENDLYIHGDGYWLPQSLARDIIGKSGSAQNLDPHLHFSFLKEVTPEGIFREPSHSPPILISTFNIFDWNENGIPELTLVIRYQKSMIPPGDKKNETKEKKWDLNPVPVPVGAR